MTLEREGPLQLQKINSMRWRIGAPGEGRRGRPFTLAATIVASSSVTA
jgi:hypothetical protein